MSTTQQPQAPSSPAPQAQEGAQATEYETIRAIIHGWSPDLRAALIHDLINTLVTTPHGPISYLRAYPHA